MPSLWSSYTWPCCFRRHCSLAGRPASGSVKWQQRMTLLLKLSLMYCRCQSSLTGPPADKQLPDPAGCGLQPTGADWPGSSPQGPSPADPAVPLSPGEHTQGIIGCSEVEVAMQTFEQVCVLLVICLLQMHAESFGHSGAAPLASPSGTRLDTCTSDARQTYIIKQCSMCACSLKGCGSSHAS